MRSISFLHAYKYIALLFVLFFLATSPVVAQWVPLNPVQAVGLEPDGALLVLQSGFLRFQVCSDSIVRVVYSIARDVPQHPDFLVTKKSWPKAEFSLHTDDPKLITLTTSRLKIEITRADSSIIFYDSAGHKLTQESTRTLTPTEVNGEKTLHSERFVNMWDTQEAFYGLGQHQAGVWNYRGEAVDLSQDNTNISIPLLLSSNGYAIFWNNGSRSRFNNRFVHAFYLSSELSDSMDYYFFYGPDFDRLIADYRELTGAAPLFGKWAYGYWQCKNRYDSQQELLAIAQKYRDLHIPLDNIVQDWFWWNTMGEPVFNKNYPDPKAMVDGLHKNNVHLMISVWPYFRPGSPVYDEMDKRGFFIARTIAPSFHPVGQALYDAFNPEARKYYWNLMNNALFKIGADAWWLDTTEAETEGRETNILVTNKVNGGENGARYANEFPLMTTTAVYEGQREASDKKRVFILSRSAYAGSQRNGAAVWSGDVDPNWETFRRQIPAGLNYSVSGLPYWTTDIGGFVSANPEDPAYRELYIRWFEFGTFCPIFRAHGTRTTNQNEIWSYGPDAQKILTAYDKLRYRLMPYIYSLAWKTTREGYTIMRPLVMDFREDVRAQNIGDEFLFGPAILVNPVTEPSGATRRLYLPNAKWYDFWTGATTQGGRTLDAPSPIDRMPLYVRAGSILPLGPEVEYAAEKSADPIELRVYRGASGYFTLYEDENDTYNYEKGTYATISFSWDEAAHTLTIGDRSGSFPGMLDTRTFRIVFVAENHGASGSLTENADKNIQYSGKKITVTQ
ncbi:MAG TPA: glycoside hydrolase family 31 protein [Verrucomicrobiae bacterium]|jgi:alpha-D-xyloside xylohydrolase|nr:glycoside hydrolase family 31 protein [Verrucomicrobiae bacterium]